MLKYLSFASGKLLFLGKITTGMLVSRGNVALVVHICVSHWDLGSEIRTFVVVFAWISCLTLVGWLFASLIAG